jgi:hypothetical protein
VGAGADLGLLFTIESDPSKGVAATEQAAAAIGRIPQMTGEASRAAGAAAADLEKSLMGPRESTRLLSEEFGLHLPRAVTGAVGQMLPEIAGPGTALLGVFAVEEVYKFGKVAIEELHELQGETKELRRDWQEVVSEQEKLLRHPKDLLDSYKAVHETEERLVAVERERVQIQEELNHLLPGAWLSAILDALKLNKLKDEEKLLNERLIAQMTQQEQLEKDRQAVIAEREREAAEWVKHEAEETARAIEQATRAHEQAVRAAEAHAKAEEHLAESIQKETIRGAHEAAKAIQEQLKEEIKEAEVEERIAKIRAQGIADFERYTMDERNYHAMLVTLLPPITEATTKTEHLSAARKELIGVTQSLQHVEDAFKHALDEENNALVGMTSSLGDIGGQLAMLIGGKKAEAEVRGAFDAAMAIEEMAIFIASWGTDTAALMASIQYGLASAEMFKVAGRSGGRGAGGGYGGGYRGGYGPSYGQGRIGAGEQGVATTGLAPGAADQGGGRISVYLFTDSGRLGEAMAAHINTFVRNGGDLTASRSLRSAPAQG